MTVHMASRSTAEATLAKQFAEQEAREPSLTRRAAFERFLETGLPTRRVETWHYTDLRAAMADAAPILPRPSRAEIEAARVELPGGERVGPRLVLLGGYYIPELSDRLPAGVAVTERAAVAVARVEDPLAALNEALSPPGCTISVAREAEIAEPITIVHLAKGNVAYSEYSRIAIVLGAAARASFVELFEGAHPAVQRCPATIMTLAKGAKATHVAVVGDEAGLHIETQIGELAETAELNAFGLVSGGDLTRRQLFLKASGDNAKVLLGGLALLDGSRRADTTLQVVHSAPGGTSREFYRAIVGDDAVGVFQGKIVVEKAAQKTDGAMKSQAILLSPRAQMNEKPELEIFADDVICGHGATVGSLDPEQVFYLRARGIPESEAKAMLLEAFGGEAIDRVGDEALIGALRGRLGAWLAARK
jgi:Fe-S cluster assembly protein SufD